MDYMNEKEWNEVHAEGLTCAALALALVENGRDLLEQGNEPEANTLVTIGEELMAEANRLRNSR
jgi:hypothetical protein